MSNAPTFEQIEDAVSRSTQSSYGPDGGIEYISPFLAAGEVEKLYAPALADLEKARAEVERLRAKEKETRRSTLLDIASAACPHCKEGKKVHKDGGAYYHGAGRNVPFCRAPEVQAMLEKLKAQEVSE